MYTIHSDIFPDGTPVDGWFHNTSIPELTKLGKQLLLQIMVHMMTAEYTLKISRN